MDTTIVENNNRFVIQMERASIARETAILQYRGVLIISFGVGTL